jgi:hypothetical protein
VAATRRVATNSADRNNPVSGSRNAHARSRVEHVGGCIDERCALRSRERLDSLGGGLEHPTISCGSRIERFLEATAVDDDRLVSRETVEPERELAERDQSSRTHCVDDARGGRARVLVHRSRRSARNLVDPHPSQHRTFGCTHG